MKYLNFNPLQSIDSSQTTVNSAAIDMSQILKFSIQAVSGAGAITAASIQLQVSNDEINAGYMMLNPPINWTNLGSSLTITAAASSYLIIQQDSCYRAMRIVFTGNGANTAPVTVQMMALAL